MKLSSWISTIPENMQLSSNNDFCLGCSYRKWQTTNQQAEFYFLPHCKYCGDERTWDWGTKIHLTCCPIDLFHIYIYMAGNWNGISTMECIFYIYTTLHCGYQGSIWILWPQSWIILVLSYPSASPWWVLKKESCILKYFRSQKNTFPVIFIKHDLFS